jgi:pimeloyl-ACP methyl ester carboxylesterase
MKIETEVIKIAKDYLEQENPVELIKLQKKLDEFSGDFAEVVEKLKPTPPAKVETGSFFQHPFSNKKLFAKFPWARMSYSVPKDYNSKKKYGLLIFLHGGGNGVETTSPDRYLDPDGPNGLGDIFQDCGRIVCAPCAPPSMQSFARWNLPVNDDYIAGIIDEMSMKYNIDPDNIILAGHSMGGQGANHMAHRFADRFASVLSSASSWDLAYWASLTGTAYWSVQGVNDATMFLRRHGTDISFTRLAKLRLDQAGVKNFAKEHQGRHHSGHSRTTLKEWLSWCDDESNRRDPFYPHVVAVTPRGMTPWIDFKRHKKPLAANQNHLDFHDLPESPHARWVTIDEKGEETIMYDMLEMSDCCDTIEEDWNNFALNLKRKHLNGALVEAFIENKNLIEVSPVNVKKFTLWLHPEMVDFEHLKVYVCGKLMFNGSVKPSLGTVLESYRRRRDWGMLYQAKLTFEDKEGSWKQRDQLKIQDLI